MDLDNFYTLETRKVSLREHYENWRITLAQDYGNEYAEILHAISNHFSYFGSVDYSFDACYGSAEFKTKSEAGYWIFYDCHDVKKRHVLAWLRMKFEDAREARVYHSKDWRKSRKSKIQTQSGAEICLSGLCVESVFWESYEKALKTCERDWRRFGDWETEIDCYEAETLAKEFLDDCLHDLMREIVSCYEADLSEENFIENFRANHDEEFFEEKEVA